MRLKQLEIYQLKLIKVSTGKPANPIDGSVTGAADNVYNVPSKPLKSRM